MNRSIIDYTKTIIPILWKFLDKKRRPCYISMNIYTNDKELVISIINSRKIKRFNTTDNPNLIKKLTSYLKV